MKITCPSCRRRLSLPSEILEAGRRLQCPACASAIAAPQVTPAGDDLVAAVSAETAPLAVPAASAPNREAKSSSLVLQWLPLGAAVAVLAVGMGLLGTGVRATTAAPEISPPAPMPDFQELVNGLKEDNSGLRDKAEADDLEKNRLREESRGLQGQIKELELKIEQLEEKVVFAKKWSNSTFVLHSPRFAVGVQPKGEGKFKVVAAAEHPWAAYAQKVARKLGIPHRFRDEQFLQELCQGIGEGENAPARLAVELGKHWRYHKYVIPGRDENPDFLLIKDLATNQHRLGFYLATLPKSVEFQPVSPEPETVPRARIEMGSARKGNAQRISSEENADLLDLFVLRAAQKLESPQNVPGYVAVAVKVQTDALDEALRLSQEPDKEWNDYLFDYIARKTKTPFAEDERKKPTRILRRYAEYLHDEICTRLSRLHVPVVEREELREIRGERELSNEEGFDQRTYGDLTSASHLVIVDVDKGTQGGAFRISMRLADANTGAKLVEDHGEVDRPKTSTAPDYVVNSGTLVLLSSKNKSTSRTEGSESIYLPPMNIDSPPRLALLEGREAGRLIYRDLFESRVHSLDSELFNSAEVTSENTKLIPRSQQLRLSAWEIAREILPAAGRVLQAKGERLTVSVGTEHGVKAGDRFGLLRLLDPENPAAANRGSAAASFYRLPMELRADTVTSGHSQTFVNNTGIESLWSDSTVQTGDLAIRLGSPESVVRIEALFPDEALIPATYKPVLSNLNAAQWERIHRNMESVATDLRTSLSKALQQVGVRCVSDAGGSCTHVVKGRIAPNSASPNGTTFVVQLQVEHSNTNEQLATLSPAAVSSEHVKRWVP